MSESNQSLAQAPGWYRQILNICWLVVLLTLAAEAIMLLIPVDRPEHFVRDKLWIQGTVFAGTMGLMEALSLFRRLRSDFTLIAASVFLMSILVYFHPGLTLIPIMLFLPLTFAVLTFNHNRILYALILVVAANLALYVLQPGMALWNDYSNAAAGVGFWIAITCMSFLTVSRGKHILNTLRSTMTTNQELLIQNIIMDKLFKTDALTELYNHKTFHEYLEKLIEHGENNGLPLQLAIIDLDNFKKVNDTYGHRVGDNVLMRTAAILRNAVTPNDFVARYGGEEFAIIFTDKTLTESYKVLERIRTEMESFPHEELGFRAVTCSIGLEEYKKGTGKESLFRNTDASLYAAKKRGKNQISSTDMPIIQEQLLQAVAL